MLVQTPKACTIQCHMHATTTFTTVIDRTAQPPSVEGATFIFPAEHATIKSIQIAYLPYIEYMPMLDEYIAKPSKTLLVNGTLT